VIKIGAGPPQSSEKGDPGDDSVQPIPVTCGCGKKFRAKAELSGKRLKCPACGEALAIPSPESTGSTRVSSDLGLDQLMAAETAAATLPHSPLGPSKKSKKRKNASNTRLIVGLSVATGAVVLVLVVLLWPSGDNAELAKEGATPDTQPSETVEAPPSPPAAPSRAKLAAARTYPSFPDAMTEPPWNDAEPPFDLTEFLKAPPDAENAAPLYLDALFEFDDIYSLFSEEEYQRRYPIVRQRSDEHRRLDDARRKDPVSVDKAAVDAWLAQYDVGFQKLAAAQQRPRCVFQTGLSFDSLLPHVHTARQVARVVEWRTRRDLEQGDFQRPIEDFDTVLRLSRDLRPRGDAVCQLVSIAVDGICCRQIVPAILTAPAVESRHCDRLLALLVEHEAEAIDPFLEANRAQYFIDRKILHDLQHRTGSFDPQYMTEALGAKVDVDSPMACITFLGKLDAIGSPLAREKYGALAGGSRLPEGAKAPALALLPSAWSGGKMLADDEYIKEVDALNRVYASILDQAGQPDRRRAADFETVVAPLREPLRETTLAVFLAGSAHQALINAILRAETTSRGTQCLVALRRWQLQHEELPKDLDTLVKAAGMSGVPIDPYSDQPLRMTVIEGEPVIYSVGLDAKDDKALSDWQYGQQPGDFIFRLGPPSD
jgi:hypothetical protein